MGLTTGQMIDRLGTEEVAKSIAGSYIASINEHGMLRITNPHGVVANLNSNVLTATWVIQPTFVSFAEAMDALSNNKIIVSHPKEGSYLKSTTFYIKDFGDCVAIDKERILSGKWSIMK